MAGPKEGGCGCLLLIVVAFSIYLCSGRGGEQPNVHETKKRQQEDKKAMAWIKAQDFVTERLKSPSTAHFGGAFGSDYQNYEDRVKVQSDGTYLVSGWVDAQNSFGATIRSDFALTLRDNGGSWSLIGEPVIIER